MNINHYLTFFERRRAAFGVAIGLALPTGACADRRSAEPAPGAGRNPVDWTRAQTVVVAMAEYRFIPSHLLFRHGLAYRLRLENRGAELHEFTAPAFLAAIDLADPAVLAAGKNEIVVAPGGGRDVYLVARRPGDYLLICADHDWAGMTGTITIE